MDRPKTCLTPIVVGRPSDGRRTAVGRTNGRSGPTAVPFFPEREVWRAAALQLPGGFGGVRGAPGKEWEVAPQLKTTR